jgi:CheY-like chemotaxis protein
MTNADQDSMKIIVVDDEPIIADTLANILNGEGHNALAFSGGEAAIRLAEVMQPDLLVTDVVMPGMDGIETAKAMLKIVPGCRIILFSGQAESTDMVSKARADGHVFEVLAKPVNPELLLAAISRK